MAKFRDGFKIFQKNKTLTVLNEALDGYVGYVKPKSKLDRLGDSQYGNLSMKVSVTAVALCIVTAVVLRISPETLQIFCQKRQKDQCWKFAAW